MINNEANSIYYYRDIQNDFPKEEELSTPLSQLNRATKVALPFLFLYQPFGKILSCGLGVTRTFISIQEVYYAKNILEITKPLFSTVLAITSIVGIIFYHPIGMLVASTNDIGLNFYQIYDLSSQGQYTQVAKEMLSLTNHCFYLMLLMHGSIEFHLASLAVQALTESSSTIEEFRKGRWLEATGHILMTGIRCNQTANKYSELKLKWEIEKAIQSVYVGELHEKWQFPSDHLPVGIEVNGVKVISWNVLNNKYINWVIEKDTQGLNGSMISDLNIPINDDGFTLRDQKVIEMVLSMMNHNAEIIALQESGKPFLGQLMKNIPSNWQCVGNIDKDEEIVFYDASTLEHLPEQSAISYDSYSCSPGRLIQNIFFKPLTGNGQPLRIFHSHVPGNPNLPGNEDFARYIYDNHRAGEIAIALGDMNFERNEMIAAYSKAGFKDFFLFSPWQTNIDPFTKTSKGIDHLFVKGEFKGRNLSPSEIMPDGYFLNETIQLLKTPCPHAEVQ